MILEQQPTLELLFEQLGLPAEQAAMHNFIRQHQLRAEVILPDADFWTEAQGAFLREHWQKDDEWAIVVDTLNEQLHSDSHS